MRLFDYIKGNRKGRDAHRIELDAMQDPLLGEAIEGFDKVGGDHTEAMERLSARIAERAAAGGGKAAGRGDRPGLRSSSVRNWSVAAAITVLVCLAGGGLIYLNKNLYDNEKTLTHSSRKGEREPMDVVLPPVNVIPNDTTARSEVKEKQVRPEARTAAAEDMEPVLSGNIHVIREPLIEVRETEIPEDFVITDTSPDFREFPSTVAADEHADEEKIVITASPAAAEVQAKKIMVVRDAAARQDTNPNASITSALTGKLAGINVAESRSSNIKIRGVASITDTSASRAILGKVIDAETGEPLTGAVVVSEETGSSAITSTDGFFLLKDADPDGKISASYLGYDHETATPDTSGYTLIAMAPTSSSLDETVIVGYGTQKKSTLVGSAAEAATLKDPVIPPRFREYLTEAIAAMPDEERPEGSVVIEFEVNNLGRPYRISVAESPSAKASREAKRLLREGPDWEQDGKIHRITITF